MYGYSKYENCRQEAQAEANVSNDVQVIYKNACGTYSFTKASLNDLINKQSDLVHPNEIKS